MVGLERESETLITDTEIAVGTLEHRIGPHALNFLSDHSDVRFLAAIVREAIQAKSIVELT
jgi:hypothetical protein